MTSSTTAAPTAFVLVPEIHTGAWVWGALAERLRESGAVAHPVELSAAPGADLETHIGEVRDAVAAVAAHAPAAQVVLVGHGYGIHPALGAADRDPGRVARVVYLDAGNPQDGDPPLALVPDQALQESLHKSPQESAPGGGQVVAPPAPGALHRWGSLAGVPAEDAALLVERAVPQPAATLTQPLRLTGAAAGLPSTGLLCTANGTSVGLVELLAGMGDPRILALAERDVRFFDLATGHWPMLSCPDELAAVLVEAAAGGGQRLTLPEGAGTGNGTAMPARTFLLDVAECPRERMGRVDLHLPDAAEPRPAVVFVHGGPLPADRRPTPRDSPTFLGYARYAASLGAVGVTLDHRFQDLSSLGRAAEDVAAAVDLARADPRVDGDRIALWFLSAGGVLCADWLAAPPPWLRCVALTYPILAPLPNWGLDSTRFHPVRALPSAGPLPLVLTRAGLEHPEIAATVDAFLAAAEDCSATLDLIDLPQAHHGFETLDHTPETRAAVHQAMTSVLHHLNAPARARERP
ncbi:alpha/beta hydrolase family protein [Streptomyces sp. NPDC020917]|uniref:alpha/beta hydrolase family protein n=1 Tax=Streptomyces sp. NPDC020917 TaxID=3365102 RepID=UPI0037B9D8C8